MITLYFIALFITFLAVWGFTMNVNHWSSVIPDRKARCKAHQDQCKEKWAGRKGMGTYHILPWGDGNPFSIHMPSISIRVLDPFSMGSWARTSGNWSRPCRKKRRKLKLDWRQHFSVAPKFEDFLENWKLFRWLMDVNGPSSDPYFSHNFPWCSLMIPMIPQAERQQKLLLQHELEREMEESKKNQAAWPWKDSSSWACWACWELVCWKFWWEHHPNFMGISSQFDGVHQFMIIFSHILGIYQPLQSPFWKELAQQMQEEKQRIEDMLRTLKCCPQTDFQYLSVTGGLDNHYPKIG